MRLSNLLIKVKDNKDIIQYMIQIREFNKEETRITWEIYLTCLQIWIDHLLICLDKWMNLWVEEGEQ